MFSVRWLLLVGLCAVVVVGCGGSDADEPAKGRASPKSADAATSRKLQAVLDMQRESYDATGTAAAIVIGGRPFWSGGSGLANRETKAAVTADTPFPIFSITKMFVGALAVKLAQGGSSSSTMRSPGRCRTGRTPTASRCACCSTRPAGSATPSTAGT